MFSTRVCLSFNQSGLEAGRSYKSKVVKSLSDPSLSAIT